MVIVNIVINDRNWYDSRIIESDPVVFQNINYATGDDRSVNVVRQRFMQDWARRIIPNSLRQGLVLTPNSPTADDINITSAGAVGYAVVAGRFLEIEDGIFSAVSEALTSDQTYYLVIKVASFTEGDTRLSTDGTATLEAVQLPYTKSHNELVIAKFYFNGTTISSFEDYTAEQEWQASVISPVPALPGLTTGSDSVLLRAYTGAYSSEAINILGIEPDKTRFYLNAVLDDQVDSTEVKLINKSGRLWTRNLADGAYLGQDMLNLYIGGTLAIDSSRNLTIGTVNTGTLGGNSISADVVLRGSTQTLSNKTLTAPIVTTGAFSSPVLTTPWIQDLSSNNTYRFASSEITVDRTITLPLLTGNDIFVFENHSQTLTKKIITTPIVSSFYQGGTVAAPLNLLTAPAITGTLTVLDNESSPVTLLGKKLKTLVVRDSDNSNDVNFLMPNVSGTLNLTVSTTASDTFVFQGLAQNITGAKTFTADNLLNVAGTYWSLANHVHSGTTTGGSFSISNTTGTLPVSRGGTNLTTFTGTNRLLYASTDTQVATIANPGVDKLLISQAAAPVWQASTIQLTGDVTSSAVAISGGNWSIATTQTLLEEYLHIGAANKVQHPLVFLAFHESLHSATNPYVVYSGSGTITNYFTLQTTASSGRRIMYTLPVLHTLGSTKKLYVEDVHLYIHGGGASGTNEIVSCYIYGVNGNTVSTVNSAIATWYTTGLHSTSFSAVDVSSYDYIVVRFEYTSTGNLDIKMPFIDMYYN